jgi:uncharacterized protein YegL
MTAPDPPSTLMPGGGLTRRPLHFLILADRSGGMAGEKMQSLNFAIADMLSHLAEWEIDQLRARVLVRALGFATEVEWHVEEPVAVSRMNWRPIEAVPHGWTNMGKAFLEVSRVLAPGRLEQRALEPAIVLVTDGRSTDRPEEFDAGLEALMSVPAGRDALRLAIAIGRDAVCEDLVRFVGDPRIPVLVAEEADQIADRLMAASSAVSHMARGGPDPVDGASRILSAQGDISRADRDTIV